MKTTSKNSQNNNLTMVFFVPLVVNFLVLLEHETHHPIIITVAVDTVYVMSQATRPGNTFYLGLYQRKAGQRCGNS